MATKGTKVPSVYKVPTKADPELKLFAESIKEAVEVRLGRRGDPRDRAITLRELIDSGMAQELLDNPFDPNAGVGGIDFTGNTKTDFTIPPTPTGFSVSAAYTSFILSWDNPQMSNLAFTEVWRSANSSIGDAIKVDSTTAFVWSEEVGYAKTYYYWVRHVSTSDIEGQYSSSGNGTTSIDIAAVMSNLTQTLADLPGYSTLTTLISNSSGTAATVIRATSAPTTRTDSSALQPNDLWVDTDDNNQLYVRNASNNGWEEARDGTLVTLVNSINSTVGTNSTNIATANTNIATLTTANAARVSEITELEAITTGFSNASTISAAITSEATARTSGDTSNTTLITNLTSTVDTKTQTFVQNSAPTAIAVGDLWIDANDNNKLYRASAVGASNWVAVRDTLNDNYPRVFSQSSEPTAVNTGDLWFDTNDSNKQYRWDGSNWVAVRDVISQAAITSEASTRATNDTANATAITTLETSTNNALTGKASTASVTAVQNAVTNGTSSQAGYGVAVNANGAVAGMYLMADSSNNLSNNTSTSNIIFEASQVTIRNPNAGGSDIVPFTVLTSTDAAGNPAGVYIDTAFIKAASITNAQVGNLSADKITTGSMSAARITAGTMSADRISGGTISGTHIAAGTLSIAGTMIADSVGKIDGFVTNSVGLYEYGELERTAFNTSGRPHIADTTITTYNDSGESGSNPSIYADSSILGLSPIITQTLTTFNWGSGTRPFNITLTGNVNGSSSGGSSSGMELALALVMRATTSASAYTSTTGYVATTSKTCKASSIVLGSHNLAMKADLNPNTQYYIWVFAGVDDIGGSKTFSDALISVFGLNK